jgi:hypothetical protein
LCHLPALAATRLQQELELQQHSLQLLSERMAGSECHQLAQSLADTEAAVKEAQEQAAAATDKKKEMITLAKVRLQRSQPSGSYDAQISAPVQLWPTQTVAVTGRGLHMVQGAAAATHSNNPSSH